MHAFLAKCEQLFHPDRVMIEYQRHVERGSVSGCGDCRFAGSWCRFCQPWMPPHSQLYLANMRSILYEQLRHSETIIFNRCDSSTDMLYLRNNIKAMNKRAQLIYESREGTILSAAGGTAAI